MKLLFINCSFLEIVLNQEKVEKKKKKSHLDRADVRLASLKAGRTGRKEKSIVAAEEDLRREASLIFPDPFSVVLFNSYVYGVPLVSANLNR